MNMKQMQAHAVGRMPRAKKELLPCDRPDFVPSSFARGITVRQNVLRSFLFCTTDPVGSMKQVQLL